MSQDKERELMPCPFCGLTHTLKQTTAREIAQEGEDEPEPWEHSESYTVVCDASRPNGPGGCGAQSGFMPTPGEAVTSWNRRAALATQPPAVQGGPLFLLHTGQIDSSGEQDEWETEVDSGKRVDEFCRQHPGQTIGLYPHVQTPSREVKPLTDEQLWRMRDWLWEKRAVSLSVGTFKEMIAHGIHSREGGSNG